MKERLQKILSNAGVLSRRKAEEAILAGRVKVNGTPVTELGTQADPQIDRIEFDGVLVQKPAEHRVILLHKPKNVVTTKHDPEGRPTVMEYFPAELKGVHPVGRLDFDSEGLLLLTTDGELTLRLTHPRYEVPKRYWLEVEGSPGPLAIHRLLEGIELEDGPGHFTAMEPAPSRESPFPGRTRWIVEVKEGRNRFVRRMCEAAGYPVKRLLRLSMGPFELGELPTGQWKEISPIDLALAKAKLGLK